MKNKNKNKQNKYTKGKSSGKGNRKSGPVGGDRPASTNLQTRKTSLSGVKSRNMSISNIPNARPGYAYLMEVGTSEMFNALNSGLTQNWLNTMRNLILRGDEDIHKVMALYNVGNSEETREAMTARLGLQRPLSMHTRGRNVFYNRPTSDMVSQFITPFDAVIAVEEWHKEFSRPIGMKVKFMHFCIEVSRAFHAQRDHGPYGVSSEHYKTNGTPYTPYESLYYTLMDLMDDPVDLNVPAHLVSNLTLEDLAVYSLALLAPTSAGMVNDHWTFSAHTNLHEEGFLAGYHSLDFGLCTDNDGRPRFIVQAPTTRLQDMSSNDLEQSCISEVAIATEKLFTKNSDGKFVLEGDELGEVPLGTYLAMVAAGVNPTDLTEDGVISFALIDSVNLGFLEMGMDDDDLVTGSVLTESSMALGEARYKPLSGTWSSWKLPAELKRYSRGALRMVESPGNFVQATKEADAALTKIKAVISGQKDTVVHTEESIAALAMAQSLGNWFFMTQEQREAAIAALDVQEGDTYEVVPTVEDEFKTLTSLRDNRTLQMWTLPMKDIVGWCKLVADKLPPQYLATGYKQVQELPSVSTLQTGEQFDINRVTDMINLGSKFRPKFNPIKNIDANNGPFWPKADQERDWLAKPFSEGDFETQAEALGTVFSGLTIDHGIGQGGIQLRDLFALMNPRWCDALWNFSSKSSMSKHERYVAVPANRVDASVTYATAEGDTQYSHMEMLIYRLFGTFRCNTTAPLADLDYNRLGETTAPIEGGLGLTADRVIISSAMSDVYKQSMYPDTAEADLPTENYNLHNVRDDTDFSRAVDPERTLIGWNSNPMANPDLLARNVYPQTTVGELKFVIDWNSDTRDSEVDIGLKALETTKGVTTFTTEKPNVVTDEGSIINANIRSYTNGMNISNVHVAGIKDKEHTTAFVSDVSFSDEGTTGTMEVASLSATAGQTMAPNWVFPSGLVAPAGAYWAVETLKLDGIKKIASFDGDLNNAKKWGAFRTLLAEKDIAVKARGFSTSVLDTRPKLKTALQDVGVSMIVYTANITEGNVPMYATGSTPRPLPELEDVKDKTVTFTTFKFEGADLPETICYAPSGNTHSGVKASEGWPEFAITAGGVPNASSMQVGAWICLNSFPMIASADVVDGADTYFANVPTEFSFSGGDLVDVGGDADIQLGPYRLPENEDIWYEQRLHEMHAAILSYSDGVYYPTKLSADSDRGMYPYHRELRGFKRALIQELQEELTKLHRLSVSPFATDNKNLLRVVKSIYVQTEYMHGYTALATFAGPLFTSMSKDALLAAQDVLVRSGQIGR